VNAAVMDWTSPELVAQPAGGLPPRTWGPKWAAAVVRAQAAFPKIEKNAEAEVRGDRANYTYTYAELGLILEKVQPVLGECGLALLQDVYTIAGTAPDADGKPCRSTTVKVVSILMHESGEYRESPPIEHTGLELRISEVGALMSFLRRYAAVNALRVAPYGEDDDARKLDASQADRAAAPQRQAGAKPPRQRGRDYADPRGDARANADPKRVKLYVDELVKAAILKDEKAVRQLWDELKPDQDAAIVVWDQIKKDHRNEFDFIKATTTVKA
jgi:hypothetical protein